MLTLSRWPWHGGSGDDFVRVGGLHDQLGIAVGHSLMPNGSAAGRLRTPRRPGKSAARPAERSSTDSLDPHMRFFTVRYADHYSEIVAQRERKTPTNRDEGIQVLRRAAAALDEIAAGAGTAASGRPRRAPRAGQVDRSADCWSGLDEVGLVSADSTWPLFPRGATVGFGGAHGGAHRRDFRPTIEGCRRGRRKKPSTCRCYGAADVVRRPDRILAPAAGGFGGRGPVSTGRNGQRQGGAGGAQRPEADVLSRLEPDEADGLRREISEIRSTGIAFDRDEHTPGSPQPRSPGDRREIT